MSRRYIKHTINTNIPSFANDVKRFYAGVTRDIDDDEDIIMKTIFILRQHGALVFNCKESGQRDVYGEMPNSLYEYFFILPDDSQFVTVHLKTLGERTAIRLPDGFQFLYTEYDSLDATIALINTDDIEYLSNEKPKTEEGNEQPAH